MKNVDPDNPGMEKIMHYTGNIKAAHLAEKRKKFDMLPSFFQAGLFLYEKFQNVRNQDFFPKLLVYDILRNEGNALFSESKYEEAARKYEEALSLFRFVKSDAPHWREEGIDDKYITEVEVKGKNEQEESKIQSIKLLCYLNLAACNLKLSNIKTVVDACNEALKLDQTSVKALYRRGKAIMLGNKNDIEECKKGITDFEQALKLEPGNELIRNDYNDALKKCKALEKKQSSKGGDDSTNPVTQGLLTSPIEEAKLMEELPELAALNETLAKGESTIKILESVGKFDAAQEQREKLKKIVHIKECLLQLVYMDLGKPAQKMKDQAKQLGISFSDEEIKRDLLKMKKNNLEEARDLIRKSLGMEKLPRNPEPLSLPEQSSVAPRQSFEEEKGLFGNVGVRKAVEVHNEDELPKEENTNLPETKKENTEVPFTAISTTQAWSFKKYGVYGVVGLLIVGLLGLLGAYLMSRYNS